MQDALWYYIHMKWLLLYLLIINILTSALYLYDKWMARKNAWRVSEKMLLLCALFGGSPAALYSMRIFRHKTRKTSFQFQLFIIIFLQVLLIGALNYTDLFTILASSVNY